MDDRVKDLLDRVRDTAAAMGEMAGEAARNAGKYAGQVADTAKLNGKLLSCKSEINGLLSKIGLVVYDAHTGGAAGDAPLGELLSALDEKYVALEELKSRIAANRSGTACAVCGALCGMDDKFCKSCGTPLSCDKIDD